jgi:hypothetical protein
VRLLGEPHEARVTVVERRWIGVFGRQAVVNGNDKSSDLHCDTGGNRLIAIEVAHHEATTVNPKESRQRAAVLARNGSTYSDSDVGRARRRGNGEFGQLEIVSWLEGRGFCSQGIETLAGSRDVT